MGDCHDFFQCYAQVIFKILYIIKLSTKTDIILRLLLESSFQFHPSIHGTASFFEKLTGFQLVKKFPVFYGTRRFITAFITARNVSLSWVSLIQSIPPTSHFLKTHLNIIIPSTTGSPKWSLSLRFPHQNPVYASPIPHTRYMLRPSHSSLSPEQYWVSSTDH